MQRVDDIAPSEFLDIINELKRLSLPTNNYRNKAGSGKSQTFGVVNRRSLEPDYSRLCWLRPLLYKHILDFAKKYVKIPFTSITLNQGYRAAAHRDKGNIGDSLLVAFGDYSGGELELLEGEYSGVYDVKCKPLITDFQKTLHSVKPFEGDRYSLVFYVARKSSGLPPPSVEFQNGKYVFMRGGIATLGLPHPLKGRKKGEIVKEEKEVSHSFL
jgi:hypothetical protein